MHSSTGVWLDIAEKAFDLATEIAETTDPGSPLNVLTLGLIKGTVPYRTWRAHVRLEPEQAARLGWVCELCGGGVTRKPGRSKDRHKRADDSGFDHARCHGNPLASVPGDDDYDKAEHRAAVHHAIATGLRLA